MASDPETGVTIRPATPEDASSCARIYNYFVADTIVTFEEEPVSAGDMAARLRVVHEASLPWLVAEYQSDVVGYAYAAKWRARSAYRFSTEVTIYLEHTQRGRGIGSALYRELLSTLKARGIHSAIGGIALPNTESVALHEKFGFEKVAHFREVGFKLGRWIDVGSWQVTW